MMRGHLKIIVLKSLAESPLSGYGLMKTIREKIGFWKVSAGSIYPLLKQLKSASLISVRSKGTSKVYTITAKGRIVLSQVVDQRQDNLDEMISHLKVFDCLGSKSDMSIVADVLRRSSGKDIPFAELQPEMHEFHSALMKLLSLKLPAGKTQKLKRILHKMSLDIGGLA